MATSYKPAFFALLALSVATQLDTIIAGLSYGLTKLNYLVVDGRSLLRRSVTEYAYEIKILSIVVPTLITTLAYMRYVCRSRAFKRRTAELVALKVEVVDVDYEGELGHDEHGYYIEVYIAGLVRHIRMDIDTTMKLAMSAILPKVINTTTPQPTSELEMATRGSYESKAQPPKFQAILHSSPGSKIITSGYGVLGRVSFQGSTYGVTAAHVLAQLSAYDVFIRTGTGDIPVPKNAPIFLSSKALDLVLVDFPPEFWSATGIRAAKIGKYRPKRSCSVLTPAKDGTWSKSVGSQLGPNVRHPQPFRYAHSASTQPGSSGGFVLSGHQVVGIHTRALRDQQLNLFTSLDVLDFAFNSHSNETMPPEAYWTHDEYDDRAEHDYQQDILINTYDKSSWRHGGHGQIYLNHDHNSFITRDHLDSDSDDDDGDWNARWAPGMAWGDAGGEDDGYDSDEAAKPSDEKHSEEDTVPDESNLSLSAPAPADFAQLKPQKPSVLAKPSGASAGLSPQTKSVSWTQELSQSSAAQPAPSPLTPSVPRKRRRKRNKKSLKDLPTGTSPTPQSKESSLPSLPKASAGK